MKQYNVILQLKFIKTNQDCSDKNPTLKELDLFMKKNPFNSKPSKTDPNRFPRYMMFLNSIFEYSDYGKMPKKIKYLGEGKIQFVLHELPPKSWVDYRGIKQFFPGLFQNSSQVRDFIKEQIELFPDTIWEGSPGSEGVFPCKDSNSEHGLISISVKKTIINLING